MRKLGGSECWYSMLEKELIMIGEGIDYDWTKVDGDLMAYLFEISWCTNCDTQSELPCRDSIWWLLCQFRKSMLVLLTKPYTVEPRFFT